MKMISPAMKCSVAILALWSANSNAIAATTAPLEVFPGEVRLKTSRDHQSLVVRTTDENGVNHDVTTEASFVFSDPKMARLEKGVVLPLADGKTDLKIEHGGKTVTVPVTVELAKTDRPISFRLDVMPVFLRAGCNTGGCHGSARGKDGFHLSLFGYDPEGDYYRLTRELTGRRINLALPEESLVLTKATGSVPHTGGKLFEKDSELYKTVVRWLEAGAPNDASEVARPVSLEVMPRQILLEGQGATQRLMVRAKYSDGTVRDVTSLALFSSSNDSTTKVTGDGLLTAGQRGEAFIMARFATFAVGAESIVIPKGIKYTFPDITERNYIDTAVNDKLKRLRIVPSDLCTDEVFVRRAYLDVIGLMPTPVETAKFLADTDTDKRAKLVDQLLGRKEFVDLWVMKLAELLKIRSDNNRVSYKSAVVYFDWLRQQLAGNVPINEIVRQLISSEGGTFESPASTFYQLETDPLKLAEDAAQSFLGFRIQCAQCHNHPFDQWTMDDYRGFVAFFTQVGRKRSEDPRETIVFNRGEGESRHPVGNRVVAPKFPDGSEPDIKGKDRRQVLADWLTSKSNPYFAAHIANVIWAHYVGRGIVEPFDDVRVSNPAANSDLLAALARKLVEYNYDFKHLIRDICTSRTYQLSTRTNPTNELDDRNFSHATVRRLRAEVLLDVICQVTDSPDKFRGLPLGARAVEIADGRSSSYFLTTFGRATRETVCSCEVAMEPSLSQALHLLNGNTVMQKISGGGVVRKMIAAQKPAMEIVDELYLRTLARKPTAVERQEIEPMLANEKEQAAVLDDVFWALLNSKEFLFNH